MEIENYREVNGDLLSDNFLSSMDYIAHQCNCVSKNSAGLYQSLITKFPTVDVYQNRPVMTITNGCYTKPGTISIIKLPQTSCSVIHMFSQFYPGSKIFINDNKEMRLQWFNECLQQIANTLPVLFPRIRIAFPYKIGCGLAGGNWVDYQHSLMNFAHKNKHVEIYIVNNSA